VVVYATSNPSAASGSGLLGCGAGKTTGVARPSNVIETKSETGQVEHSAPFPRALVAFFLKSFSDPGDVAFDPFMGSGTTMAAAHTLDRNAYGCEISPGYCDVIVRRLLNLKAGPAVLAATGQTFEDVQAERQLSDFVGQLEQPVEALA
jgi:DNA modification methylase